MGDSDGGSARPLRADARRNRARVLEVAVEIFAVEGLSVPVHEIARRAGVGTGTVSRHFPTKESLFEAIVLDRVERIVGRARELTTAQDPGAAFFELFAMLVEAGATDRGLAEGFAGVGFDMDAAALRAGYDVVGVMRELLVRAQRAGAVRADLDVADVKALMMGCVVRERDAMDVEVRNRMIAIVCQGFRPA
ncbi:TetR/AcrR family transcriptional regulator [Streptosporangium subroseum]|uniref:TetR/AcrR family transcriptional regulator n=1 Tax=Streptosporangium subroseum TaxID=106412 RepID=UPI0030919971|nr:TetR/AcrR family transcriptional regulator [Streptosporangium subroseum]